MHNRNIIYGSHGNNSVYCVQACKTESLGNRNCFLANKRTDVTFGSIINSDNCTCKAQWYMIGALTLMIIGLIYFILVTTRKCRIFRGL